MRLFLYLVCSVSLLLSSRVAFSDGRNALTDENRVTSRQPSSDTELRYWLENATRYHRFSAAEIQSALGLTETEQKESAERLKIDLHQAAELPSGKITVLPFPGGRHPRIGFRDGAIDPQRETKVSVFTPWQPADRARADYVVVDVPEALWSNLGLTYLAHTHIPTIWDKAGKTLPPLEWNRRSNGTYEIERQLPNGITFRTRVVPRADHVAMELTLHNGTREKLSDLRVQNCIMLRDAAGFNAQIADNKLMQAPYACCHDASGKRWIITAWVPNQRTWGNPPCPCLHSDPQFPDCEPGETKTVRGWLSFYEGKEIASELRRLTDLKWDQQPLDGK